jgi:hypothetical protein
MLTFDSHQLDISSLNGRTVSVVRPAGADGPTIYNFDKLCRPSETSKSHLSFREEGTVASDSLVALFPDRANNKLSFGAFVPICLRCSYCNALHDDIFKKHWESLLKPLRSFLADW